MTMYRGGEFSDRFQELAFMVAPRESHKNWDRGAVPSSIIMFSIDISCALIMHF